MKKIIFIISSFLFVSNLLFAGDKEDIVKHSTEIISIIKDFYHSFNDNLLIKETFYNDSNIFLYSLIFYILAFLLVGVN